jgi:uncharacterized membrane protein
MRIEKAFAVSAGITVAMAAASLWALQRVPDTPLPVQWGLDGRPDMFAPPSLALLLPPAVAAALTLVFALLPKIMPRKGDLSRSRLPYAIASTGTVAMLFVLHLLLIAYALGAPVNVSAAGVAATGALIAVIGNYLPKTRYNYLLGIRTPWTLADERVWDRTHRFTGVWLMVAGVVAIAIGVLAPDRPVLLGLAMAGIGAAALAGVFYSAWISLRGGSDRSDASA